MELASYLGLFPFIFHVQKEKMSLGMRLLWNCVVETFHKL